MISFNKTLFVTGLLILTTLSINSVHSEDAHQIMSLNQEMQEINHSVKHQTDLNPTYQQENKHTTRIFVGGQVMQTQMQTSTHKPQNNGNNKGAAITSAAIMGFNHSGSPQTSNIDNVVTNQHTKKNYTQYVQLSTQLMGELQLTERELVDILQTIRRDLNNQVDPPEKVWKVVIKNQTSSKESVNQINNHNQVHFRTKEPIIRNMRQ